jgi:hypothetical protein
MAKKLLLACLALGSLCPATANGGTFGTYNLSLTVPVYCKVGYNGVGSQSAADSGATPLGNLQEYCNAPSGYSLVVNYSPGALRGAELFVGSDRVILDGSGRATVSQAQGPRIRNRPLAAIAGQNGFDTDRLDFELVAN